MDREGHFDLCACGSIYFYLVSLDMLKMKNELSMGKKTKHLQRIDLVDQAEE